MAAKPLQGYRMDQEIHDWIRAEAKKLDRKPGWFLNDFLTKHITPTTSVAPKKVVKKKAAKKVSVVDTELQSLCREIWASYATAYFNRYGVEPVRNAKVNTAVKGVAQRLGSEAVFVAEYYVSINDQFLIKNLHNTGLLLTNCETYRTQWATGQQMTTTTASQIDKTQSNLNAVQQAKEIIRKKYNG